MRYPSRVWRNDFHLKTLQTQLYWEWVSYARRFRSSAVGSGLFVVLEGHTRQMQTEVLSKHRQEFYWLGWDGGNPPCHRIGLLDKWFKW